MKVLFITRKYPPQIGGMESFSYGLINKTNCVKDKIVLNKKQIHLIWWLPYAFIAGIIKACKADIVHLGDGVLSPLGFLIKYIVRKPVVVTIHGLDITYRSNVYQWINVFCLRYLDKIICISKSTKKECIDRKILNDNIVIIPDGVDIEEFNIDKNRKPNKKIILLTVGRLVKRKGVAWFVKEVVEKLDNTEYWIAGTGPEKENISKLIKRKKLQNKVRLLGYVDDEELKKLYQKADLFIMPNIYVLGDREGFGIVAIEATASGLPVVASNIEGIMDAVKDGKNGVLAESHNVESFVKVINNLLSRDLEEIRKEVRKYTVENYSWKVVCDKYIEEFGKVINS